MHEIVIKLNLVYPRQKKTAVLTNFHVSRQGIALQKEQNHVKCAVHNCDSDARKCQYKNNKNINFIWHVGIASLRGNITMMKILLYIF